MAPHSQGHFQSKPCLNKWENLMQKTASELIKLDHCFYSGLKHPVDAKNKIILFRWLERRYGVPPLNLVSLSNVQFLHQNFSTFRAYSPHRFYHCLQVRSSQVTFPIWVNAASTSYKLRIATFPTQQIRHNTCHPNLSVQIDDQNTRTNLDRG